MRHNEKHIKEIEYIPMKKEIDKMVEDTINKQIAKDFKRFIIASTIIFIMLLIIYL